MRCATLNSSEPAADVGRTSDHFEKHSFVRNGNLDTAYTSIIVCYVFYLQVVFSCIEGGGGEWAVVLNLFSFFPDLNILRGPRVEINEN